MKRCVFLKKSENGVQILTESHREAGDQVGPPRPSLVFFDDPLFIGIPFTSRFAGRMNPAVRLEGRQPMTPMEVSVAVEPCDMGRSFDGLYHAVANQLKEDPKSGSTFAFTNKRRSLLNRDRLQAT